MRITFVRPNLRDTRSADAMEPLCFGILKRLTPAVVDTALYDERLEPIPLDEPTDLVAMTVETFTARRAYQLADAFRARGVPVVMGGYHPTLLPEEAQEHADAVVVGDAEGIWPNVVRDARRGTLAPIYRRDAFAPLTGITPDRSIYRGKTYAPVRLVQYGRGCRFNCDFCSIRAFYGPVLRQRPVAEVVREIEELGTRHVIFVDDNLFVDPAQARALFEALVPLHIHWSCQVSIDVTRDRTLVDLMARSGCVTALVGFESLNPQSLREMRKGWNIKFTDYDTALDRFRDVGIMVYGTFVFGYDHDTVESFDATLDFAVRRKLYLANFNPLTPTPGTALLHRLRRERRMRFARWWLDPRYRYGDATFHPRGMSAEELTAGCYRARTAFNTARCITRRMLDYKSNLRSPYRIGIYVASNLVSRREIHAKQGQPLGAPTPPATALPA